MSALPGPYCGEGDGIIDAVASAILEQLSRHRLIAFSGELGAGKTTLIKALCKKLGVTAPVSSPTYALVNEYTTGSGAPLYHFDWYRIKSPQELLDIGIYEYLDSHSICLIEWPSMASELLEGEPVLKVHIAHVPEGRCYEFSEDC